MCQPGYIERFVGRVSVCELSSQSFKTLSLTVEIKDDAYLTVNGPLLNNRKRRQVLESDQNEDDGPYVDKCNETPDSRGCIEWIMRVTQDVRKNSDVIRQEKIQLLQQELRKGMDITFRHIPGYAACSLLTDDAKTIGEEDRIYSNVQVVLSFDDSISSEVLEDPGSVIMELIQKCQTEQYTSYTNTDLCVLPTGLHVAKSNLTDSTMASVLNPCNETQVKYCSEGSECHLAGIKNNPFYFRCECPSEGFTIDTVVDQNVPEANNGPQVTSLTRKLFCADIDECTSIKNPHQCPKDSECINELGSYDCICKHGSVYNRTVSHECLDVCTVDPCQNGGKCDHHPTQGEAFRTVPYCK